MCTAWASSSQLNGSLKEAFVEAFMINMAALSRSDSVLWIWRDSAA